MNTYQRLVLRALGSIIIIGIATLEFLLEMATRQYGASQEDQHFVAEISETATKLTEEIKNHLELNS